MRMIVSGLLVVAVHACLLLALLLPAPARVAPPPVLDVALLMAPGPGSSAPAVAPAPARTSAGMMPARPAPLPTPARLAHVPAPLSAPVPARAAAVPAAVPAGAPEAAAPMSVAAPAVAPADAPGGGGMPGAHGGVQAGDGGASADGAGAPITPPQLDPGNPSNPRPAYPAVSRRLGEAGVVALRLRVAPDGRVTEVQLLRSSGYDRLDQAALQAVRRWTLRPARQAGQPVAAWMPYSIRFELEK